MKHSWASLNRSADGLLPAGIAAGRTEATACLCADTITIAGQTLMADATKAYIEFRLSHALPVVMRRGDALHPATVRNSHQSLLHQHFNFNHEMRAYDPEKKLNDHLLGTVVAVELVAPKPIQNVAVEQSVADAPHIRGVAVMSKTAQGADWILSKQAQRPWATSMEFLYQLDQSAFAFNGANGWEFVPWMSAGGDLRACWSTEKNAVVADYKGRRPVMLCGGINGAVHYMGVGLVEKGNEPTATTTAVLHSADPGIPAPYADLLAKLRDLEAAL